MPDLSQVTLKDIFEPLRAGSKEILAAKRDSGKVHTDAEAKQPAEVVVPGTRVTFFVTTVLKIQCVLLLVTN